MIIKVLGTGCSKCKTLEKSVQEAVNELHITAKVEKIEDILKIMEYGVIRTPALVINEKVVISGRIPSSTELESILKTHQ